MKEKLKKFCFAAVVALVLFHVPQNSLTEVGISPSFTIEVQASTSKVSVSGKEYYSKAFQVLKKINAVRKKHGKSALIMDKKLLKAAMKRSYEISVYFSHERPNGSDWYTICNKSYGENIASGQKSASQVVSEWMDSPGHRKNILNGSYKSIGIGVVKINGVYYWVQEFGYSKGSKANASSYSNKKKLRYVVVDDSI